MYVLCDLAAKPKWENILQNNLPELFKAIHVIKDQDGGISRLKDSKET